MASCTVHPDCIFDAATICACGHHRGQHRVHALECKACDCRVWMDEDEDDEELRDFWAFLAGQVFGLMLADVIAHPRGAAELMEATDG